MKITRPVFWAALIWAACMGWINLQSEQIGGLRLASRMLVGCVWRRLDCR